jgi:hypothetical protein
MVAYELYLYDEHGEEHLVGILPERRKDPARITNKSVLKWGKLVLGGGSDIKLNNLYFTSVELRADHLA